jgi:hypothetical protein
MGVSEEPATFIFPPPSLDIPDDNNLHIHPRENLNLSQKTNLAMKFSPAVLIRS